MTSEKEAVEKVFYGTCNQPTKSTPFSWQSTAWTARTASTRLTSPLEVRTVIRNRGFLLLTILTVTVLAPVRAFGRHSQPHQPRDARSEHQAAQGDSASQAI